MYLADMASTEKEKNELKVQGVVEAAQDPESNVSADDAQKKIVEESKKAGITAFTFDPDASPEEKRAQAAAVSRATLCKQPRSLTDCL
ncbi:hypothetical protein KNSL1_001034 [Colletotrichum chrysophilum]|nr:hypothetical protein KNSL1_001034 [Colletotrichum chrysophilum]